MSLDCNDIRTVFPFCLAQNGMLHGVNLAREYMSTKYGGRGGSIVNIASVAGRKKKLDYYIYNL